MRNLSDHGCASHLTLERGDGYRGLSVTPSPLTVHAVRDRLLIDPRTYALKSGAAKQSCGEGERA